MTNIYRTIGRIVSSPRPAALMVLVATSASAEPIQYALVNATFTDGGERNRVSRSRQSERSSGVPHGHGLGDHRERRKPEHPAVRVRPHLERRRSARRRPRRDRVPLHADIPAVVRGRSAPSANRRAELRRSQRDLFGGTQLRRRQFSAGARTADHGEGEQPAPGGPDGRRRRLCPLQPRYLAGWFDDGSRLVLGDRLGTACGLDDARRGFADAGAVRSRPGGVAEQPDAVCRQPWRTR